jgi:hypothetical protein
LISPDKKMTGKKPQTALEEVNSAAQQHDFVTAIKTNRPPKVNFCDTREATSNKPTLKRQPPPHIPIYSEPIMEEE